MEKLDIDTAIPEIIALLNLRCGVLISIEDVVFSNIFPEKKKRVDTYHYFPSEGSVELFFREFDGLVSEDMFDPKIKHVNLYDIQIHLP